MTPTTTRSSRAVFAVAVTLAAVVQLALGYLYLVSGLAVPAYALFPLWLWWGFLTALMSRWVLARSWWALAVPVVAYATWTVVLFAGDAFLGWTA